MYFLFLLLLSIVRGEEQFDGDIKNLQFDIEHSTHTLVTKWQIVNRNKNVDCNNLGVQMFEISLSGRLKSLITGQNDPLCDIKDSELILRHDLTRFRVQPFRSYKLCLHLPTSHYKASQCCPPFSLETFIPFNPREDATTQRSTIPISTSTTRKSTERSKYRSTEPSTLLSSESTTTEKEEISVKKNAVENVGALVEDILQNSHADTIIKSIEEKNLEQLLLEKHGLQEKENNYQVEFPELEDNYYYIDDEEYYDALYNGEYYDQPTDDKQKKDNHETTTEYEIHVKHSEIESERIEAAETEAINQVEVAETEAIDNQAEDLYDHLYDDHTQSKETFGHAVDTEQINEVEEEDIYDHLYDDNIDEKHTKSHNNPKDNHAKSSSYSKVNDAKASIEDDFYDSLYDYDDDSTKSQLTKSHSKIKNHPKSSHSKGQYNINNHHTKSPFEQDTKSHSETKGKNHKNKYLSEYKQRNKITPNKHFSKELFSEFSGENFEDSCVIKCRRHEALEAELERLIRINEAIKASIEYKEERRSRGFIDENKPSTDNEKLNGRVFHIGFQNDDASRSITDQQHQHTEEIKMAQKAFLRSSPAASNISTSHYIPSHILFMYTLVFTLLYLSY